jgi:hypothetical protein
MGNLFIILFSPLVYSSSTYITVLINGEWDRLRLKGLGIFTKCYF